MGARDAASGSGTHRKPVGSACRHPSFSHLSHCLLIRKLCGLSYQLSHPRFKKNPINSNDFLKCRKSTKHLALLHFTRLRCYCFRILIPHIGSYKSEHIVTGSRKGAAAVLEAQRSASRVISEVRTTGQSNRARTGGSTESH